MRTALIILGLWLLLNVLFVVAMTPPRKPRKQGTPGAPDGKFAPATIDKEAHPFEAEEEKTSLGLIIMSVGMGVFFVLGASDRRGLRRAQALLQKEAAGRVSGVPVARS
jgi:hypothetical protein